MGHPTGSSRPVDQNGGSASHWSAVNFDVFRRARTRFAPSAIPRCSLALWGRVLPRGRVWGRMLAGAKGAVSRGDFLHLFQACVAPTFRRGGQGAGHPDTYFLPINCSYRSHLSLSKALRLSSIRTRLLTDRNRKPQSRTSSMSIRYSPSRSILVTRGSLAETGKAFGIFAT